MTGGSRGIGRGIVEALAANGREVAFTWHHDEAAAESTAAASGGRARPFRLDLRDREGPMVLVEEVEAALGPVWGLVNNAGVHSDGLLALMSDAEWDSIIDVNLGGVFRCCRAVIPGMVRRRAGCIVNVSSLSAMRALAGQAAYSASKAGILALTRSLAREVGKRGVRVNAVVPGFVETDLTAELPPPVIAGLRAGECLPGGVTPRSVAGAVVFLLSEEASAVTGHALVVDAGASL